MAEREHWLAGRVAVITGASSGIGRATAEAIAREGGHAIVAARGVAALDATVATIRDSGGQATAVPTDVCDASAVKELFSIAENIVPPAALVCAAATLERETAPSASPAARTFPSSRMFDETDIRPEFGGARFLYSTAVVS